MQGAYRVRVGPNELVETFVAAAGPAGWRYFGRGHEPDGGSEIYRVDHVVDLGWNLVRFRWSGPDGAEVVAIPRGDTAVEVWVSGPGGERRELVAGAFGVWAASPSSLLVVDRLLSGSGEISAVMLRPPFEPRLAVMRLDPVATAEVSTPSGLSSVREVRLTVDGESVRTLLRFDLPLLADGWFELVE
jgi:hypothetical protein